MSKYVLVHGAWHTGKSLEPVAASIAAGGHKAFTPTIRGNRPEDPKTVGLNEAIDSILAYLVENDLRDVLLVGHSYGGMVITGAADRVPGRIRRLIYWSAFVPNDGERVIDMIPPSYVTLFNASAAERGDGSVVLPLPVWREAFINDVDPDTARRAYDSLNPHPLRTLTDRISLRTDPSDMVIPRSYISCTEDISLPHPYRWHPRLSRKLGSFRLIEIPGSHEVCFSNPGRLARAIMAAGCD